MFQDRKYRILKEPVKVHEKKKAAQYKIKFYKSQIPGLKHPWRRFPISRPKWLLEAA